LQDISFLQSYAYIYKADFKLYSLKKVICVCVKVLEEVRCPQLSITARDDCPNEKEDGLASRIWKYVA
jgi:hypothetical protein